MRTQGHLRVMLNSKLWPEMTLDRANEKSLRITVMEAENDVKIYLIMVSKPSPLPLSICKIRVVALWMWMSRMFLTKFFLILIIVFSLQCNWVLRVLHHTGCCAFCFKALFLMLRY